MLRPNQTTVPQRIEMLHNLYANHKIVFRPQLATLSQLETAFESLGIKRPAIHLAMMSYAKRAQKINNPTFELELRNLKYSSLLIRRLKCKARLDRVVKKLNTLKNQTKPSIKRKEARIKILSSQLATAESQLKALAKEINFYELQWANFPQNVQRIIDSVIPDLNADCEKPNQKSYITMLHFLSELKDFREPTISLSDSGFYYVDWYKSDSDTLTIRFHDDFTAEFVWFEPLKKDRVHFLECIKLLEKLNITTHKE